MKFALSIVDEREIVVIDGVETLKLPASFASDLSGLGQAVVRLLHGVDSATCAWTVGSWHISPGDYRWLLARDGDDLELRILRFPMPFSRKPDEQGELVFSTVCALRRFAVQVKNALEDSSPEPQREDWATSVRQKLDDTLRATR